MKRTKVVITSGYLWMSFEWFLLGFYMLQDKGEIKLRFRLPFLSTLLRILNWDVSLCIVYKILRKFEKEDYNMSGYIIFPDGVKKTFTIDCADSPFLFNEKKLRDMNVYFKMQYPVSLGEENFFLTDNIRIPWVDCRHIDKRQKPLSGRGERRVISDLMGYQDKIKPLMMGVRRLSRGISYRKLRKGYERYIKERCLEKPKRLMCYFGNSKGPEPNSDIKKPDFNNEADIMGYFGEKISHPNEKRAKVAEYISGIENCDARVISTAHSDSGGVKDMSQVIPLTEWCAHVAKFQYNFNVSGYRRSIPNRFVEGFMVGTGIVTDKLAVKWYKPFDKSEVIETIEMGYLPNGEVDWQKFEQDLFGLPVSDPKRIVELYEEKWEPSVVARYIIETVKDS